MKPTSCLSEWLSSLGIGSLLLLVGLMLVLTGLTVLPVIGLVVAAPVIVCAGFFLLAARSAECRLR
jgi:hypothetical protein